jgi:hypothetical protein
MFRKLYSRKDEIFNGLVWNIVGMNSGNSKMTFTAIYLYTP